MTTDITVNKMLHSSKWKSLAILYVIVLNVDDNAFKLSVLMLNVFMLNALMLNVANNPLMLSVALLDVVC